MICSSEWCLFVYSACRLPRFLFPRASTAKIVSNSNWCNFGFWVIVSLFATYCTGNCPLASTLGRELTAESYQILPDVEFLEARLWMSGEINNV